MSAEPMDAKGLTGELRDIAKWGYMPARSRALMISAADFLDALPGQGQGGMASRDLSPSIGSSALIGVVCEDLETLAEELGEHFEMQDGPCEDVCTAWVCQGGGCIKDKADRARKLAALVAEEQAERDSSREDHNA